MRSFTFLAATGAVLAIAVAGCSSGSDPQPGATKPAVTTPSATPAPFAGDSAQVVLAKAKDAADSASSVHAKGSTVDGGQRVAINMKLKYGTGAYGYVKIGKDVIQIRRVGKTTYMKAGDAFWKKNAPGSERLFGGQWIKGGYKSGAFAGFNAFTTKSLVTSLLDPDGKITRVAGKDIGGVATVGLKDNDKTDPGVLYIAATGKAYPLMIEPTGKKSSGSLTLTEWDQPVTVTAPGGAIDIDKLSGASA